MIDWLRRALSRPADTVFKAGTRRTPAAPLRVEPLECRLVPAFTATFTGGPFPSAVFTGNSAGATGDTVIFAQSGGLLAHNRAADGGFNSPFDFDSAAAGDQTVSATDANATVRVNTGAGPDQIQIGGAFSTFSTPATTLRTGFVVDNGGTAGKAVVVDDSQSSTANTFNVIVNTLIGDARVVTRSAPAITSADVKLFGAAAYALIDVRGGSGADTVFVTASVPGVNLTDAYRIATGAGNDSIRVGSFSAGLNGLRQNFALLGGADADTLAFDDAAGTIDHAYTVTATTVARTTTGNTTGTFTFDATLEQLTLNTAAASGTTTDALTLNLGTPFTAAVTLDEFSGPTRKSLVLTNATVGTVTQTFTTFNGSGTIQIDSRPLISYSRVFTTADNLVAANRVYALVNNGLLDISDDAAAVAGVSQLTKGLVALGQQEVVTFANPTTSLTATLNNLGETNSTLNALETAFAAGITLNGMTRGDTFTITPQRNAAVTVNGGLPTGGAFTDSLTVNVAGATVTALPAAGAAAGTFTFANRAPVAFTGMEAVTPTQSTTPTTPSTPSVPAPAAPLVVGAGASGRVTTTKADGTPGIDVLAFPGFGGPVSVASGDVNGDGTPDAIVATLTGTSHVKVLDGVTGAVILSFFAFDGFAGGATVGSGDVDGDGRADVLVGAASASSHVKAFSGLDGRLLRSFLAFDGFAGGVTVAGAGRAIVVGTATGAAHVKTFDGQSLAVLRSFFAFANFAGGVAVGATDLNGDGVADLIVGTAAGSSHVKALDGRTLAELASLFAFDGFTGGVSVAGSGGRIVAGVARSGPPHVKAFDAGGRLLVSYLVPGGGSLGIDV